MIPVPRRFCVLPLIILALTCTHANDEVTVGERIEQISPIVHQRIRPWFARQRVAYPPSRLALVVIKDENRLKVFAPMAGDADDEWRFIMQYEVAKLSGRPGPKLRNGDKQVPEGVYDITYLHPTSKYWLSLGLDYPNSFDRARAREDGRKNLGGDIMIHGWWFSTGCVAMGNTATEDLFVMAHDVKPENVDVIIAPTDFRTTDPESMKLAGNPRWTRRLYQNLETELAAFGSEGMSSSTKLIAYTDIAPPPPVKKSFLMELLEAVAEAAETSAAESLKRDTRTTKPE